MMDLSRTADKDVNGNPLWQVTLASQVLYSTTAADILSFYAKIQSNLTQLQADAGQTTTTTPPPVTTPPVTSPPTPTTSGFRGIFAFNNMSDTSLFSDNPSVAGTVLTRYWAELEPQAGVFNWALIDNDMKPWVAAGKSVIIRIATAGWKSWQPAQNSGQGTPQWVYDQGVPFVTDDDGSKKPQYWSGKFLDALSDFVHAFASRYDGNANILCVEIGVGDGGETKPDTSKASDVLKKWQAIGYTDPNWWMAIQAIAGMYITSFTKTPLAIMPDASFIGGTSGYNESKVVNYATANNLWLQWNGLTSGASLPGSFSVLKKGYPLILEQLNSATANKRSLDADLQTMLSLGAVAALVFTDDISNPANVATLAKYAAMVGK